MAGTQDSPRFFKEAPPRRLGSKPFALRLTAKAGVLLSTFFVEVRRLLIEASPGFESQWI